MAAAGRNQSASLVEQLEREPYAFSFFQAVRLLELHARRQPGAREPAMLGDDGPASAEPVHFEALPSLTFPPGEISALRHRDDGSFAMQVAFMGLTGPSGILPHHYTSMIIERLRQSDPGMRDFFDLFNHRAISLFYRAWTKYRLPIALEQTHTQGEGRRPDHFTELLMALVGMQTRKLGQRLHVPDPFLAYCSGFFANMRRSASALESVLSLYFDVDVQIDQFNGQWLYLPPKEQSQMPSAALPLGSNCALGVNAIVGERVWSVASKFRIRVGPLDADEFASFLPSEVKLQALAQLTRLFVGVQYDFDVQLTIRRESVPQSRVSTPDGPATRLGWNSWVHAGEYPHDADDPVFSLPGTPVPQTTTH